MQDMGHIGPNGLWLAAHTLVSWSIFTLVCCVMELAVFSADWIAKGHFSAALGVR